MKKIFLWTLVLCLALLVGCGDKTEPESTVDQSPETEVITLGEEDINILASTLGKEESSQAVEKGNLLEILEQGSFTGRYLEDGSDESVENVVCALIRNNGDGYLDYGVVNAVSGDVEYCFVVTGIPGGDAVWVMEKDRKTSESGETLDFLGEQVSQVRDDLPTDERVSIDLLDGRISITNVSHKVLASVRIYYKQVHSDGNFLGGITYTCVTEELQPGATVEVTGGHSRAEGCAVVRVDVTE